MQTAFRLLTLAIMATSGLTCLKRDVGEAMRCVADLDCRGDRICVDGTCEPVGEGEAERPVDASTDVPVDTPMDASLDAATDVGIDAPLGCWECADPGIGFSLCQARDAAPPLCVFGDGRAGDICTADIHCATGHCFTPAWDTVGFCTVTCEKHWDCPNSGRCVFTDGFDDFCAFLCIDESHCPPGQYPIPLPDMGPPDA